MTMASEDGEIRSVRRAASKAWFAIERKHRKAMQVAIETKRQLDELEAILSGREPPSKTE
jgi:hypothetical protein